MMSGASALRQRRGGVGGKARGLRRYRCKACGKTFGALTVARRCRACTIRALAGLRRLAWRRRDDPRGSEPRDAEHGASWRGFLAAVAKRRTSPGSSRWTRPSFSRAGRGIGAGSQAAPARRQGPQTRPLARAGADPGCRRAPARPSATPCPPSSQRREGGAGAGRPAMPCSLLTPTAAIRLSQVAAASLTKHPLSPPASLCRGPAHPDGQQPPSQGKGRWGEETSAGGIAASKDLETACREDHTSEPAISHRPERVSRRRGQTMPTFR